ncbi:MAG: hypothetical protein NTX50_10275 [Candidatus Sumerlaeota bacterium]|nr:hypothetical protein [Candidatus Sumerlaeota bacterium]
MVDPFRWIAGVTLLLFFAWIAGMNAFIFWRIFLQKRQAPSWVPLLGGGFGVIGLLTIPFESAHTWWWLPLILDWGSLPGILHAIVFYVVRTK